MQNKDLVDGVYSSIEGFKKYPIPGNPVPINPCNYDVSVKTIEWVQDCLEQEFQSPPNHNAAVNIVPGEESEVEVEWLGLGGRSILMSINDKVIEMFRSWPSTKGGLEFSEDYTYVYDQDFQPIKEHFNWVWQGMI